MAGPQGRGIPPGHMVAQGQADGLQGREGTMQSPVSPCCMTLAMALQLLSRFPVIILTSTMTWKLSCAWATSPALMLC